MKKLTAEDIVRLANDKKSFIISSPRSRIPAAFLQNMPFRLVMRYLASGVYEYKVNEKVEAPWPKGELLKLKK